MKNKNIFFLMLFLLPSITTQCMLRNYESLIDNTTRKLSTTEKIYNEIEDDVFNACLDIRSHSPLIGDNYEFILSRYRPGRLEHKEIGEDQKNFNFKGYSFLGLATISTGNRALYCHRKCFINQLLRLGFKPTEKDFELAFLEKWKRCAPIICLISCAYKEKDFLLQAPNELIKYISFLIFKTEESLL